MLTLAADTGVQAKVMEPLQLKSVLSRMLPCYHDSGWSQRLIFVALALLIALLELIFYSTKFDFMALWTLILSTLLLASCGWFAPWSEILYILAYDIILFLPVGNHFPHLIFGVCAISVSWLARSWVVPGLVLYLSTEILSLLATTMLMPRVTESLLETSLVLPLGFFLRWHRLNAERMSTRLRQVKEIAAQAEARVRRDLATELHDTIARDLVRLLVLANRLEKHPDSATAEDFRQISELSVSASRGIRPVIAELDARRTRRNLSEVIDETSQMLSSRNMNLRLTGTSNLEVVLTRQQLLLAILVVQECATNALKYGVSGTEVTLEATLDDRQVLTLIMRNQISPTPNFSNVSSGLGLDNLESRLVEENGELILGQIDQKWIVKAVIPPSREEEP